MPIIAFDPWSFFYIGYSVSFRDFSSRVIGYNS